MAAKITPQMLRPLWPRASQQKIDAIVMTAPARCWQCSCSRRRWRPDMLCAIVVAVLFMALVAIIGGIAWLGWQILFGR